MHSRPLFTWKNHLRNNLGHFRGVSPTPSAARCDEDHFPLLRGKRVPRPAPHSGAGLRWAPPSAAHLGGGRRRHRPPSRRNHPCRRRGAAGHTAPAGAAAIDSGPPAVAARHLLPRGSRASRSRSGSARSRGCRGDPGGAGLGLTWTAAPPHSARRGTELSAPARKPPLRGVGTTKNMAPPPTALGRRLSQLAPPAGRWRRLAVRARRAPPRPWGHRGRSRAAWPWDHAGDAVARRGDLLWARLSLRPRSRAAAVPVP